MFTWLSAIVAALRAFGQFLGFIREDKILKAGEAKGRLDAQADQAKEANEADKELEDIAQKPADKTEALRRLGDGTA